MKALPHADCEKFTRTQTDLVEANPGVIRTLLVLADWHEENCEFRDSRELIALANDYWKKRGQGWDAPTVIGQMPLAEREARIAPLVGSDRATIARLPSACVGTLRVAMRVSLKDRDASNAVGSVVAFGVGQNNTVRISVNGEKVKEELAAYGGSVTYEERQKIGPQGVHVMISRRVLLLVPTAERVVNRTVEVSPGKTTEVLLHLDDFKKD